jgi:two-component system, cell cycle response regulator
VRPSDADTDGFELNARIWHDPRWHHIPVIAMTGLDSQADYHRTLEAGFAGHLAKPIDIEVLCSTIQNAIKSAASPSVLRRAP